MSGPITDPNMKITADGDVVPYLPEPEPELVTAAPPRGVRIAVSRDRRGGRRAGGPGRVNDSATPGMGWGTLGRLASPAVMRGRGPGGRRVESPVDG
jgi:hypothetical protein